MTLLPIASRELRVIASRAGLRWVRVGLAGLAMLFCLQWLAINAAATPGSAGQAAFRVLVWAAFVLACASTFITADCVSAERREGTLGLLFLTDLKGHDIVLGKLVATGLNALYALLGFAPVLMLPLVTGGVTGGEVVRTALALLNLLLVALAGGMLISVRASSRMVAFGGAALLLAGLHCLPALIGRLFKSFAPLQFELVSPLYAILHGAENSYTAGRRTFWISLMLVQFEGWLLLAAASWLLLRGWRESLTLRRPKSGHERRRRARERTAPRPATAGHAFRAFAPVAYAMLRLGGQRSLTWVAAGISALASVISTTAVLQLALPTVFIGLAAIFYFCSSGMFAWVAGRFLFEARQSGELELLLPTPAGANGVIRDQWFALMRLLRGPLLLVVAGTIPLAARYVMVEQGMELVGLVSGVVSMANAVMGVLAVCWVSMWTATWAKRPIAIIAWTVGLVDVAAIIGGYVLVYVLAKMVGFQMGGGGRWSSVTLWSVLLPFLLLCKNLFFIWWAHERLRKEFRTCGAFNTRALKRLFHETPETTPYVAPSAPGPNL